MTTYNGQVKASLKAEEMNDQNVISKFKVLKTPVIENNFMYYVLDQVFEVHFLASKETLRYFEN